METFIDKQRVKSQRQTTYYVNRLLLMVTNSLVLVLLDSIMLCLLYLYNYILLVYCTFYYVNEYSVCMKFC